MFLRKLYIKANNIQHSFLIFDRRMRKYVPWSETNSETQENKKQYSHLQHHKSQTNAKIQIFSQIDNNVAR